jgi:hypothetical protein
MAMLSDRIFADESESRLFEICKHDGWHLDKAHALYELAFRSILRHDILDDTLHLIGQNIRFADRLGTPLGQPAAALLVDTNDKIILAHIAKSLSTWSAEAQRDFALSMYDKNDRQDAWATLIKECGLVSKIAINQHGEVMVG